MTDVFPSTRPMWHWLSFPFPRPGGYLLSLALLWSAALGALTLATTPLEPEDFHHLNIAAQKTWAEAYDASLKHTHPPLALFAFRLAYLAVGHPLALRAVSLAAMLAALLFAWLWLSERFGRKEADIGVWLLAPAPHVLTLANAMRGYAFLLAFSFLALWCGEVFTRTERRSWLLGCLGAGLLACFSHFSGVLVFAALLLDRLVALHQRGKVRALRDLLWGTLGSAAFLAAAFSDPPAWVAAHRSTLVAAFGVSEAGELWDGRGSWFTFGGHALGRAATGLLWLPGAALPLAAILGCAVFGWWGSIRRHRSPRRRFAHLSFAGTTLALALALSSTGIYPLGATPHCAYLLPFLLAWVVPPVARVLPQNLPRSAAFLAFAVMLLALAPAAQTAPGHFARFESEWNATRRLRARLGEIPKGQLFVSPSASPD